MSEPERRERDRDRDPTLKWGFLEVSTRITLIDLLTIGLVGVGVLTAYYDLRGEAREARAVGQRALESAGEVRQQHDRELAEVRRTQEAARSEIKAELRDLAQKTDEILRFLRGNERGARH